MTDIWNRLTSNVSFLCASYIVIPYFFVMKYNVSLIVIHHY